MYIIYILCILCKFNIFNKLHILSIFYNCNNFPFLFYIFSLFEHIV